MDAPRIEQAGRVGPVGIVIAIAAVAVLVFWFAATYVFEGSLREPVVAAPAPPAAAASQPASSAAVASPATQRSS